MNPPIHLKGLFPDVHFEKIEQFFSDSGDPRIAREKLIDALADLNAFYVVCFTNRCGSNYLAQCLASDGRLRQAGETLNHDTVINQARRHGLRSFDEYLAWLVTRLKGPARVVGVKASAGQLIGLYNRGILSLLQNRLHFVHLVRKELLVQAVSYYIAIRTNRWTSTQQGQSVAIDYAPNEILGIAESISRQNAAFSMLFGLLQVEPISLTYDRLVSNPDKITRRLGSYFGIPNLRLVPEKISYEKQADAINLQLLDRLSEDFSLESAGNDSISDADETLSAN